MVKDLKEESKADTVFFVDWMKKVMDSDHMERAEKTLSDAESVSTALHQYFLTPQSAPWHSEGIFVSQNIVRTLAGFYSILSDQPLAQIEELARMKDYNLEVEDLEKTIKENEKLLEVFILTHDIAKPLTLSFDAPADSLGSKEGFLQSGRRLSALASSSEKQLYIKLFRAFETTHLNLSQEEVTAKFFDKYEIRAHYYGHAERAMEPDLKKEIQLIADHYSLTGDQFKMLMFLIKHHMTAVSLAQRGEEHQDYDLFIARAHKAELDSDKALDLILASMFIDGSVGSLHYGNGSFSSDLSSVSAFMKTEAEVAGFRREGRRKNLTQALKKHRKEILASVGLDGDSVFKLLNTQFGAERGRIMHHINECVEDKNCMPSFASHQTELTNRVEEARRLFDEAGLT